MNLGWKVNISPGERAGRIVAGLVGIAAGVALLAGSPTAIAAVLEILLIAAGADLLVTGAIGHCPLHQKLGHVPRAPSTSPRFQRPAQASRWVDRDLGTGRLLLSPSKETSP